VENITGGVFFQVMGDFLVVLLIREDSSVVAFAILLGKSPFFPPLRDSVFTCG